MQTITYQHNIHDEINSGEYECLICLNSLTPQSHIWSCRSCFRVYDLHCIKQWGIRSVEKRGEWNCPHCLTAQTQNIHELNYRCWCGKQKRNNNFGNSKRAGRSSATHKLGFPHSCGQTCGAKRSCPHPCPLPCHAGSHANSAECLYMGPKITCFCGKTSEQLLCSESRYGGFSCTGKCLRVNPICKHKCQRSCHERSGRENCGPCQVQVKIKCYCGEITNESRVCSSLTRNQRSNLKSKTKTISCSKICGAMLDCGKHFCTSKCHGSRISHVCPLKPREGETCFCGQTKISRKDCLDAPTSCGGPCNKTLECGHKCPRICHDGECPTCDVVVTGVRCRCKATTNEVVCADKEPPRCSKKCDALLSCKRHKCRQACCEFSFRNFKPPKTQRAYNFSLEEILSGTLDLNIQSNATISEAEQAAHLCIEICGRPLSCGSHTCPRSCHSGKCPPCLATSFEEWSCPCGQTIVEPPIRCGTVMPLCRAACTRIQECGHDAQHLCHSDGVSCAPCPVLIDVPCKCGKSMLKEKCHIVREGGVDVSKNCSAPCGEILPCGHSCRQTCCPGDGSCPPCQSSCEQEFACGHKHGTKCHFPEPCPSECTKILMAKCPCGFMLCKYDCGEYVEVGCTEKCLEESYHPILIDGYEHEKRWFLQIEHQIREFLKTKKSKTLWFKPMNKRHRRFVYYMLDHYGLQGESVDFGENRSICARYTENAHLPKLVLQNASKVEPFIFLDQVRKANSIVDLSGDEDDSSEDIGECTFDDGFVKVSNKNSLNIGNSENTAASTTPTNLFQLLR